MFMEINRQTYWSIPPQIENEFYGTLRPQPRFRSGDWGSAVPSSFGWWGVVTEPYKTPGGIWLPRGCLVRYREYYTMQPGRPNVGLKLPADLNLDLGHLALRVLAERPGHENEGNIRTFLLRDGQGGVTVQGHLEAGMQGQLVVK